MLATVTVCTHINTQHAIALFNLADNSSTGTITKQHAGVAVGPVHDAAQGFGTDNQHLVIQTALYHLTSYSQAVNKAAAACCQVKSSCVLRSQARLYQAGGGREDVIAGRSANNYQIQLLSSYAGICQSCHGSLIGQVAGCFLGGSNMTLLDTSAFGNPFITGFNNFFHVLVSDNFFRNIMSYA